MVTFHVKLNDIAGVRQFNSAASRAEYDIDIVSGRYVIDAKSIMGLFSLDLSRDIQCILHCEERESQRFLDEIREYISGDIVYKN